MKKLICYLLLSFLFVSISQGQNAFRVERKGTGKPILFLPGFGSSGDVWDPLISKFPQHESITLTYAGFDGVSPIDFPWYSQISDLLINFVKENNLNGLTVVGHSMGGNLIDPLKSNVKAHRFYQRLGFEFIQERKFEGSGCFVFELKRH